MKRLIVGISGATGVQMGYRLLQALRTFEDIEVHLVVSDGAKLIFERESDLTMEHVEALADVVWDNHNLAASISSGSFRTDGMVVVPCSMKSGVSRRSMRYGTERTLHSASVKKRPVASARFG